jgi:hypothetical protein
MKKILYLIVCLLSFISYSQDRILKLKKINSETVKIIKEHKRIKVQTIEGKKYVGKFTIVNDSTILIANEAIVLDSIVKLRKKSLFNSITNPVFITVGSLALLIGTAGAIAGGYGYIATVVMIPPGIPLLLLPSISNQHPKTKWEYTIEIE